MTPCRTRPCSTRTPRCVTSLGSGLTSQLNELERSIHPRYRLQWRNGNVHFGKQPIVLSLKALNIHIALQQERLRIHRPVLVRGKGYERSRAACLEAASTLLAIHRSPFMRAACFGGLTYKTIAAATCLAIDLLQSHGSDSFDATAVAHRDEVVHACVRALLSAC